MKNTDISEVLIMLVSNLWLAQGPAGKDHYLIGEPANQVNKWSSTFGLRELQVESSRCTSPSQEQTLDSFYYCLSALHIEKNGLYLYCGISFSCPCIVI